MNRDAQQNAQRIPIDERIRITLLVYGDDSELLKDHSKLSINEIKKEICETIISLEEKSKIILADLDAEERELIVKYCTLAVRYPVQSLSFLNYRLWSNDFHKTFEKIEGETTTGVWGISNKYFEYVKKMLDVPNKTALVLYQSKR